MMKINKKVLALTGALAMAGGWSAYASEASDGTMIAVDFRTGVRVVESDVDILPITWSSQWGGGAATVTSACDASVTEVPETPSMPGDAPTRTLVDAQTGEGETAFVSVGAGLYKLTHAPSGETAWFLVRGSSSAAAPVAYDGRVFTAENPRPVETLDDVWEIAYSGKNWDPAASDGTVTLELNSSDGSVTLLSTTGEGDYTLDRPETGDVTLTHTAGGETVTAYLRFQSSEPPAPPEPPAEEKVMIDTDGDDVPDTEVLARGGASWLDLDGSGEEGPEARDKSLLITAIDYEETDAGVKWRITFRPRLKGGAKNLQDWFARSQANDMIRLCRAGTGSALAEVAAEVAEGEIKPLATEGGVPEEVILTKEAIDGSRVLWQVDVK